MNQAELPSKLFTPTKVFLTGATGYIGGSVLTKLLEPSQAGKWDITVLTRSEETIPKLKKLGVTPLLGTLEDDSLLTQAAKDADVVLSCANADHLSAVKALVSGLNSGEKRRILLHNSGTGVLVDDARGDYASDKVYSDFDIEAIHDLPTSQPHRDVDAFIFGNNKNFESIIIAPPLIYGQGVGPFNQTSVQIPLLMKGYLKAGCAGTIGKGLSKWNHVHVENLADFYVFLLELAIEGKASTGKDGWYFCETGEHVWKDIESKIGEELYKNRAIKEEKLKEFTPEEVEKFFGKDAWFLLASNSRSRAERGKELGWKPTGKYPSVYDSIENEVKIFLEKEKQNK